jgi:hypothetical protein
MAELIMTELPGNIFWVPGFKTFYVKFKNKFIGSFTTRVGAEKWLEDMQKELDLD